QTSADFWRSEYTSVNGVNGYLTGDYRLGPLASHLFGVSLNCDLGHLAPASQSLGRLGLRVSYDRYFNSNNYSANFLETGPDFRLWPGWQPKRGVGRATNHPADDQPDSRGAGGFRRDLREDAHRARPGARCAHARRLPPAGGTGSLLGPVFHRDDR